MNARKTKAMIVAGVMSGTSADGIDVAVVRIQQRAPRVKLLAHEGFAFPAALRRAVLSAMNAESISTAELARLNWRLGIAYAEAVSATIKKHPVQLDLIGCHGQTLFHQPTPVAFAGRRFACTWQAGEAAVLAGMLHLPVVSNFRPGDMLAGGQGAPLVPLFDYALFSHAKRVRVLQNIGGIANLTAIPANGSPESIVAFDNGPGNMVIDSLSAATFQQAVRSQWHHCRPRHCFEARARMGHAESIFSGKAAAHGGTRAIWPRICREVSCRMPAQKQEARRCIGHGDSTHGREHLIELQAICEHK